MVRQVGLESRANWRKTASSGKLWPHALPNSLPAWRTLFCSENSTANRRRSFRSAWRSPRRTSGQGFTARGHSSASASKRPGSVIEPVPPPLLERSSERLNPSMGQPRKIWRLLNLPCQGMTRLASESLDRDLDRVERLALRTHLLICAPCRRYFKQIKILGQTFQRLTTSLEADIPTAGPTLPENVRSRIKARIKAED